MHTESQRKLKMVGPMRAGSSCWLGTELNYSSRYHSVLISLVVRLVVSSRI